jgi:hypothetical protein
VARDDGHARVVGRVDAFEPHAELLREETDVLRKGSFVGRQTSARMFCMTRFLLAAGACAGARPEGKRVRTGGDSVASDFPGVPEMV